MNEFIEFKQKLLEIARRHEIDNIDDLVETDEFKIAADIMDGELPSKFYARKQLLDDILQLMAEYSISANDLLFIVNTPDDMLAEYSEESEPEIESIFYMQETLNEIILNMFDMSQFFSGQEVELIDGSKIPVDKLKDDPRDAIKVLHYKLIVKDNENKDEKTKDKEEIQEEKTPISELTKTKMPLLSKLMNVIEDIKISIDRRKHVTIHILLTEDGSLDASALPTNPLKDFVPVRNKENEIIAFRASFDFVELRNHPQLSFEFFYIINGLLMLYWFRKTEIERDELYNEDQLNELIT